MVDRNADALASQLLTLPTADRARLAALLLASLEPAESEVVQSWDAEIHRREAELDTGAVQSIAAADVFSAIERKLNR